MAQRYQREIEEILEQVNEDAPSESEGKETRGQEARRSRAPKSPRTSRPRFTISSGKLMLAGIVLLVLSLPLGALIDGLTAPAAWLGIGLLIAGYVLYFTKPRRSTEKRWRGEVIEDEPEPNGFQRFWRWLTRG